MAKTQDPFSTESIQTDGPDFLVTEAATIESTTVSVTTTQSYNGTSFTETLGEVIHFDTLATASVAAAARAVIRTRLLTEAKTSIATRIEEYKATAPAPQVSSPQPVAVVAPAAAPVAGGGAAAVLAAANGAPIDANGMAEGTNPWGDTVRYRTSASYSTDQFRADVATKVSETLGLLPGIDFVVYDNRTGPKGLESGTPNGSVANVNIVAESDNALIKAFVASTQNEKNKRTLIRVLFNDNGTFWLQETPQLKQAKTLATLLAGG